MVQISARHAAFLNLKRWLTSIGNNQLAEVNYDVANETISSKGGEAFTASIRFSTGTMQKAWANRYLSEDVGQGVGGNGTYGETDPAKQPYQWHGRGLKQLTHKENYQKFGQYLDAHPGIIEPFAGMTFEQAFSDNPNRLFDITDRGIISVTSSQLSERGRMLMVASAAWFWSISKDLNDLADQLNFDESDKNDKGQPFFNITQKVNGAQNGAAQRFVAYNLMQRLATADGDSYENIVCTLGRLGMSAHGESGYKDKFGIFLNKRTPLDIEVSAKLTSKEFGLGDANTSSQLVRLAQDMSTSLEDLKMLAASPMPTFDAPATAYVVLQQSAQVRRGEQSPVSKLGICSESRANDSYSINPVLDGELYADHDKNGPNITYSKDGMIKTRMDAVINIAKAPNHGSLALSPYARGGDITKYGYHYVPDKDYVGDDNFWFDVSVGGKTLRIYYQIMVYAEGDNPNYIGYCNWEKYHWKISQSSSSQGLPSAWQDTGLAPFHYTQLHLSFASL